MTHKVYNFCISLLEILLPIAGLFSKKVREFRSERKGLFKSLANQIGTQNKYAWFHFASLGEFNQGRYLLQEFKSKNPQFSIIVSFFSSSGYKAIKGSAIADIVTYLPVDSVANAEQFVKIINPEIAIFTKYEFWLNHLHQLKLNNTPTLLISAIINDKLGFAPKIYNKLIKENIQYFSKIYTQDHASAEALKMWGYQNAEQCGDTRVDSVIENLTTERNYPWIKSFGDQELVWIVGSSWKEDEEIVANVFKNLSEISLIIAPHDVSNENIDRIKKLFPTGILFSNIDSLTHERVIIIDKIGELAYLYNYSDFVHIGGGFGNGIHNTLEPAVFGKPITFGPKHTKFPEAISLKEMECGFQVNSAKELEGIIKSKFMDNDFRLIVKNKLDGYFNLHKGASKRILTDIEGYLR